MGMRGTWNRYTLDGVENTDYPSKFDRSLGRVVS